jgi:hypothetical protein
MGREVVKYSTKPLRYIRADITVKYWLQIKGYIFEVIFIKGIGYFKETLFIFIKVNIPIKIDIFIF